MTVSESRKRFEPKGEMAEWEMLYSFFRPLEKGTIARYEQISNVLGRNILTNRSPVYRAMKELETKNNRSLLNIPQIGYRITIAQEHENLARLHHKKSRRQITKAVGKIASADKVQLTREERLRFENIELALRQQADMIKRLDARVTTVEQKQKTQDDTAIKLDRLMIALERHGIKV